MKIFVDGKAINIEETKKVYGEGTEGKIFKKDNKAYKIYHNQSLDEGYGNKEQYHKELLLISGCCNTIILPNSLEYDEYGNYIGYVTKIVGDGSKKCCGISNLSWTNFIKNIKNVEKDVSFLTEHKFLLNDLSVHNSIFSNKENKLYVVDPGRYHINPYFGTDECRKLNNILVKDYFKHLLEMEAIELKIVKPKEAIELVKVIFFDIEEENVSDYFEKIHTRYENPKKLILSKTRYLK